MKEIQRVYIYIKASVIFRQLFKIYFKDMNYTPYQSGLVGSLVLLRKIRAIPGETLCTLVDPEEESFENFMSAINYYLMTF